MTTTHTTFCRICEALCGLEVDVTDGRVTDIRPDAAHVATRGFACVKGIRQQELYASPDRLTQPMKRVGDRHVEATWDEALAAIGGAVRRIRSEHDANAIAMYVGTAAGFSVLHPAFAQGFMQGLGSTSLYSTATQDCANKFAVARHMYGFPFTQPFPDIDETQCLVIVGANPAISKWSFLQVSNPVQRIKAVSERGGRVIVVDPRRTETAKAATEHVFIRPGTDAFFYAAFLHEVIARGAVDRARVEAHMRGYDALAGAVAQWTPERAAVVTKIPASVLRGIVDAYLTADGAVLYSSTGVNMGARGSVAFWLQEAINAVTGNLDRRGGTIVGQGVLDFAAFGVKHGLLVSEGQSRVGGLPRVNDALPGGVLADEILTPGPQQVRALFVTGGNPLITMPNASRLRDAFEKLELLVCVDVVLNETASLADWVLPAVSPLQRPDLPFLFPLMLGMQSRPYLQATHSVVPPDGGQRDETSIYVDLARACGTSMWGSRVAQRSFELMMSLHTRRNRLPVPTMPQELLLNLLLRSTRQPGFKKLLRTPHGLEVHPRRAESFLGHRVATADGRVDLAPAALVEAANELDAAWTYERDHADALKLITKRAIRTHNSWTHNAESFIRGTGGTNHLYMHPDDAGPLGLEDGSIADVSTDTATVRLPVTLLEDLMPGVVALPHGWGHQHARGLSVASATTGVNVNLLAADGPAALERVSGMAHLTGFVVRVTPAAGPRDGRSWSGISPEA